MQLNTSHVCCGRKWQSHSSSHTGKVLGANSVRTYRRGSADGPGHTVWRKRLSGSKCPVLVNFRELIWTQNGKGGPGDGIEVTTATPGGERGEGVAGCAASGDHVRRRRQRLLATSPAVGGDRVQGSRPRRAVGTSGSRGLARGLKRRRRCGPRVPVVAWAPRGGQRRGEAAAAAL